MGTALEGGEGMIGKWMPGFGIGEAKLLGEGRVRKCAESFINSYSCSRIGL